MWNAITSKIGRTNSYKTIGWYAIFTLLLSVFISIPNSLHAQMAEGETKFVGNIFNSGNVPHNFDTYWNQVTPENSGKWVSVEGVRDNMVWTDLDGAYNHAQNNN